MNHPYDFVDATLFLSSAEFFDFLIRIHRSHVVILRRFSTTGWFTVAPKLAGKCMTIV